MRFLRQWMFCAQDSNSFACKILFKSAPLQNTKQCLLMSLYGNLKPVIVSTSNWLSVVWFIKEVAHLTAHFGNNDHCKKTKMKTNVNQFHSLFFPSFILFYFFFSLPFFIVSRLFILLLLTRLLLMLLLLLLMLSSIRDSGNLSKLKRNKT